MAKVWGQTGVTVRACAQCDKVYDRHQDTGNDTEEDNCIAALVPYIRWGKAVEVLNFLMRGIVRGDVVCEEVEYSSNAEDLV